MNAIKTLSIQFSQWLKHRDAVRELSNLSDRDLCDIGVDRADIEARVRGKIAE